MITNGYAELNDIKARIGSSVDRGDNDAMLEHCVEAASRYIDRTCNRRFYLDGAASARLFMGGYDVLLVDDIGSTTSLVIKTDDDLDGDGDTTIAATEYQLQPVNALVEGKPLTMVRHASCWPSSGRAGWAHIEVTAKWGWPSVPTDITEACLIAASRLFAQRNSPAGVLGGSVEGMPSQVLGTDAPTFWRLVGPYKRHALA